MKRLVFLVGNALLAVLVIFAFVQDLGREHTTYQRTFLKSLSRDERGGVATGVRQLQLTPLSRVDRCTTCHLAIDTPQLALAEEPFTAHPGDYLKWHPVEKFGCTVCHGGQGLATDVAAAHGEVKHWEQPLLRGELVQSSCYKCHGDTAAIERYAPTLVKGLGLYKEHGCIGCHAINGVGQTVSIDLGDIGDKPWQLLDFTFVEHGHGLSQWVDEHFQEPRRITPGFRKDELPPGEEEIYPSFMPNYGLSDAEASALTVYMLALTSESLPASYVTPPPRKEPEPVYASSIAKGKAVFDTLGCAGCHGPGGLGGRKNPNAWLGEEVPSLAFATMYHDRESLKEMIQHGRQPVPRANMQRPNPPLFMPAWKDRVTDAELDALVDYVISLADTVNRPPPAAGSVIDVPSAS